MIESNLAPGDICSAFLPEHPDSLWAFRYEGDGLFTNLRAWRRARTLWQRLTRRGPPITDFQFRGDPMHFAKKLR